MSTEKNNRFLMLAAIALIVLITFASVVWINNSAPTAQREDAVKQTAMLVEVERLSRGNFTPIIEGLGTVQAAQDIVLKPRVNGQVTQVAATFIPGSILQKGEPLLKVDSADYQNSVKQRESALQQARSLLDIELGQRSNAEREYALLNKQVTEKNRALILREPQLASARAAILAAEAALDQARLDLQRTSVKTPFAAQIVSRNVNVGSQVDASTELARIVGIAEYWIVVTVPVAQLGQIRLPKNGELGAPVMIHNRAAWSDDDTRTGHVLGLIGALEQTTRLARVLVSVKDPLALQENMHGPALLIDSIVQAKIQGKVLNDVFRIGREHLHENDTLWLYRNGQLAISQAIVVFKDKQYAYISEGIQEGDLLVVSNLATVAAGVSLRTSADSSMQNLADEE